MVRFSVRGLALYIAFVGLTLALTRIEFVTGGVILAAAIAAANFLMPVRVWRFVTYGALAGIVAGIIALIVYLNGMSPGPFGDQVGVVEKTRPFVVQVGALVGGTVGLLWWRVQTRDGRPGGARGLSRAEGESQP